MSESGNGIPVHYVTDEFFRDAMRMMEAHRVVGYGGGGRDTEQEITFSYQTTEGTHSRVSIFAIIEDGRPKLVARRFDSTTIQGKEGERSLQEGAEWAERHLRYPH